MANQRRRDRHIARQHAQHRDRSRHQRHAATPHAPPARRDGRAQDQRDCRRLQQILRPDVRNEVGESARMRRRVRYRPVIQGRRHGQQAERHEMPHRRTRRGLRQVQVVATEPVVHQRKADDAERQPDEHRDPRRQQEPHDTRYAPGRQRERASPAATQRKRNVTDQPRNRRHEQCALQRPELPRPRRKRIQRSLVLDEQHERDELQQRCKVLQDAVIRDHANRRIAAGIRNGSACREHGQRRKAGRTGSILL